MDRITSKQILLRIRIQETHILRARLAGWLAISRAVANILCIPASRAVSPKRTA